MGVTETGSRFSRFAGVATALTVVGALLSVAVLGRNLFGESNLPAVLSEWVSAKMLLALGLTTYLFLAIWWASVAFLFRRQPTWASARRLSGWWLMFPPAMILGSWLKPGAGGSLGAWLALWLDSHLGRFWAVVTTTVLAWGAVTLLLDRLVLIAARLSIRVSRAVYARLPAWPRRSRLQKVRPVIRERPAKPKKPKITSITTPEAEPRPEEYDLPPLELLEDAEPFPYTDNDPKLREQAHLLEQTFTDFGLNVRVVGIHTGPVITQYEVALETGLRVNKVTTLADDLALNLKVPSVRVVAPIPGKNTVGIEVPNEKRAIVRLKELIEVSELKTHAARLPLFLGKDTEGQPLIYDLAEMPHLLIAGRTGTGKSVCMNAVILSLLMTRTPEECRMIMIDPKMLELSEYGRIPHLMHPVVKDMKKAEAILAWAVDKMEERYELLARARVRGIAGYNELDPAEIHRRVNPIDDDERKRLVYPMPYIVIFIDEMNDLMMTMKKEVESHVIRLAQKSRAAGIHLIVATQKPTVDVITGLIKSNLPARICFQVSSRTDSRVVLDEMGAEKLLGKGDMLFLQPGTSQIVRAQGSYAGDQEIGRVVEHLECDPDYVAELVTLRPKGTEPEGGGNPRDRLKARDELYEQAIEIVLREGRGSTSLIQRALGVGYGRAARLIDFMAEDGIVGDYNGSQAREVLLKPEEWDAMRSEGGSDPEIDIRTAG
ncbi:MAG: DNA translocase FtsK [Gemmataceae bacterium]